MMSLTSAPSGAAQTYPWHIEEVSYGLKLLTVLGFVLLACLAVGGLLGLLGALGVVFGGDTFWVWLPAPLFPMLSGAGIVGLVLLWPQLRRPSCFTPQTRPIDPQTAGAAFSVRFEPPPFVRTLQGDGTVRFGEEGLAADGILPPDVWMQLGIIVLVTVIPLAFLGSWLGIIPALVIAYYVGRRQTSMSILYAQLADLSLNGTTLDIRCPERSPCRLRFRVCLLDGERLYRELYQHAPQVASAWDPALVELFRGKSASAS